MEMLSQDEKLEESGDLSNLIDAYHRYKALTKTTPDCKACRFHMGQAIERVLPYAFEAPLPITANLEDGLALIKEAAANDLRKAIIAYNDKG